MPSPTSIDAAAIMMSLTQGVAAWYSVVPDVREVIDGNADDPEFMREFRRTELMAGGITLGVGALGSLFLKTEYPLVASIMIVGLLVLTYEIALRVMSPSSNTN